jgi:acetyl esterase/lipase
MKQFRILTLCCLTAMTLYPAEGAPNTGVTRLPIWPENFISPGNETESDPAVPTVDIHIPATGTENGTAVVVLPGGGYGGVSMDYEAKLASKFLTDQGITAFIIRYRHAPRFEFPSPLEDAHRAVRWVRSHATDYKIKPNHIGIMGFSAGGHLASMVITRLDLGDANAKDPVAKISARPDFSILIYPVITLVEEAFVHKGSRTNLVGGRQELWQELSTDLHVTAQTPPTFLVHGGKDKAVPPENSLQFAAACRNASVPVELHILSQGDHGFRDDALRNEVFGNLQRWLLRNQWVTPVTSVF